MLTIQCFGRVPELVAGLTRDLRVLWACEELGLAYAIENCDFEKLATESLSPFAQLPVIIDGDVVLSESGAILNYLAEKAGDTARRTELSRWSFAALSTLEPAVLVVNLLAFQGIDAPPRPMLEQFAKRHLGAFDKHLAAHEWVVDGGFSVADILLVTVLRQLAGLGIVEQFPHVHAYQQRGEARPAWQRVLDAQAERLGVPRAATRRTIPERRELSQRPAT